MKSEKKVDMNGLSREEKLKYEIAEELGLLDRVLENGWKTLSAKETGRIGGLVTKRRRSLNREEQQDQCEKGMRPGTATGLPAAGSLPGKGGFRLW